MRFAVAGGKTDAPGEHGEIVVRTPRANAHPGIFLAYYKDEARTDEAWRGGVSAAPDPVRGQVVKATIRLVKGTEPTEELKKDVQNYVKSHTAPYKYPRIVVFRDELPKTISGKIQRNKL